MRIGNWRFTVEHIDPDDDIEREHEPEVWVDSQGKGWFVDNMTNRHVRHALSMVLRKLRAKNAAIMTKDGKVIFGQVMDELLEDQMAVLHNDQVVPLGFWRKTIRMMEAGVSRAWVSTPNHAPIRRKSDPKIQIIGDKED